MANENETDPVLALLLEVQRRLERRSRNPWETLWLLNHRGAPAEYRSAARALLDEAIGPLSKDRRLQVVARAIRLRRERIPVAQS